MSLSRLLTQAVTTRVRKIVLVPLLRGRCPRHLKFLQRKSHMYEEECRTVRVCDIVLHTLCIHCKVHEFECLDCFIVVRCCATSSSCLFL